MSPFRPPLRIQPRKPRPDRPDGQGIGRIREAGYTLTEMLVTSILIVLVSAAVLRFSLQEMERGEVNSVAVQLSGWLEAIQSASMRLPPSGSDPDQAGCVVTFEARQMQPGSDDAIATVTRGDGEQADEEANACSPEATFRMPASRVEEQRPSARITISLKGPNPIRFTPRGTVVETRILDVVIHHRGTTGFGRCVRVNGITGLIEIGRVDPSNSDRCDDNSFTDLI